MIAEAEIQKNLYFHIPLIWCAMFEKWRLLLRILWRHTLRSQAVLLRGVLCWSIGAVILINDEVSSYDRRLELRGHQQASNQIVLVTFHPQDMIDSENLRKKSFAPIRELTDVTESFYWNGEIWAEAMMRILQQSPKKVGVTFYFPENLGNVHLPLHQIQLLKSPEVLWASHESLSERVNQPLLANEMRSNIGLVSINRDEDGVIRKFYPNQDSFISRLSGIQWDSNNARLINFRGTGRVFPEYSIRDVLNERVPKGAFKNKYVLIGPESSSSTQYLTPLGPSSKHEVLAQILDNCLESRWIFRGSTWLYLLYLIPILVIAIYIITNYPQTVALIIMLWLITLTTALSAWVFDFFSIWIPAVSTAMMLAATWIVFIGYRANIIEDANHKLQQEKRYLAELEQLKNNFVSLISHDLKTPIAKIQAIVDRLTLEPQTAPFLTELNSLRISSDELHRYIQSILKVLRVESRDFKLNIEVGDINETVQEAIDQLGPLAAEKKITIRSNLEPMFSIEADFTLMKEVLINIIENAIKYTPESGKIDVVSKETKSKIWIEVSDTGEGIPEAELKNVWRKFVRGKDQDYKTKGSGLGLYLVKYFIELHGGEVFLESKLGVGTKISFSLPIEEAN